MGHVYALELETGRLRWKHGEQTGIPTSLIRRGSTLFAVTLADELIAVDINTGRLRWRLAGASQSEELTMNASPAVAGDQVFFGTRDGDVYALSAESGAVAWKRRLPERICTTLVASGDDLYAGTVARKLFRLNRHTGELAGEIELPVEPAYAPLVTPALVVVPAGQTAVIAVDRALTEVRWRYDTPSRRTAKGPALHGSRVLIGTAAGEVISLRLDTGERLETRPLAGRIRCLGTAAGRAFAGTQEGTVYVWATKP